MRPHRTNPTISTLIGLTLTAFVVGVVAGRGWVGVPVTAANAANPAATATRQAELAEVEQLQTEVERLRTQVAQTSQPLECTAPPSPTTTVLPSPTPTPTPVPPAAMNQPLPYRGDTWTVTVTGVTKTATVTGYNQSATAKGIYVLVNLTATNNGTTGQRFPFQDFILVDDRGRVFELATTESIMVSGNWSRLFPPSLQTDTALVFDVMPDAGDGFVLESRADPMFRVQADIIARG
jgi:Domain of unknown function (DUF4352)